jgi:5-(carboxyamino)imidazole ribonucleotide mutase
MSTDPIVAVVMGSASDLEVMRPASTVLDQLGIAHEVRVVSAHRTPTDMVRYATEAAERGLQVIIAGAGGAAHLPGMIASLTPLPVIGVPVPLRHLDGMDSLLSIVQMPAGVPVATVGVGNARNAALLAGRILGTGDPELRGRIVEAMADAAATARAQDLAVSDFAVRPTADADAATAPPIDPSLHLDPGAAS